MLRLQALPARLPNLDVVSAFAMKLEE